MRPLFLLRRRGRGRGRAALHRRRGTVLVVHPARRRAALPERGSLGGGLGLGLQLRLQLRLQRRLQLGLGGEDGRRGPGG